MSNANFKLRLCKVSVIQGSSNVEKLFKNIMGYVVL